MSDNNHNFKNLKGLLKLKRHEIPPPGYFHQFSGDVIARIRAGETGSGSTFWERIQSDSSVAAAFSQLFATRLGAIGAMTTTACLLGLLAVLFADRSEPGALASDPISLTQSGSAPTEAQPMMLASAGTLAPPDSGISISTNPISSLQPLNAFFGSAQNPLFQTVKFAPDGH